MVVFERNFGCESMLVQAKLGHDLRSYLEDTFRAPLPGRLAHLADELCGYAEWRYADQPEGAALASPSTREDDRPLA